MKVSDLLPDDRSTLDRLIAEEETRQEHLAHWQARFKSSRALWAGMDRDRKAWAQFKVDLVSRDFISAFMDWTHRQRTFTRIQSSMHDTYKQAVNRLELLNERASSIPATVRH